MDNGKFNDIAFFQAIESRRQAEKLSWRQLGRKLDLSPSTFSRLARGRRPDVDTFLRLIAWLNLPAETFIAGTSPAPKELDTLGAIRTALQADPHIRSGGADALEHVVRVVYARLTSSQGKAQTPKARFPRAKKTS